jgi:hypothetical protein
MTRMICLGEVVTRKRVMGIQIWKMKLLLPPLTATDEPYNFRLLVCSTLYIHTYVHNVISVEVRVGVKGKLFDVYIQRCESVLVRYMCDMKTPTTRPACSSS